MHVQMASNNIKRHVQITTSILSIKKIDCVLLSTFNYLIFLVRILINIYLWATC